MKKHLLYLAPLFMLLLVALASCLTPNNYPYAKPPKTYTHGPNEKPDYKFLNNLVDNADFVFEGKPESGGKSFYGYVNGQKRIYSCGMFTIYKVFKGDIKTHKIELCTEGGVIYDKETESGVFAYCDDCEDYGDGFNLGDVGVVFAKSSQIVNPESKVKIENRFNLDFAFNINARASNYEIFGIAEYYDIPYFLYNPIEQRVGKKPKVFKKYDHYQERFKRDTKKAKIKKNSAKTSSLAPTINSISPDTITAGTNSVLTINGANFDSTTMKIQFINANNGGTNVPNSLPFVITPKNHIKSWSATKIEVYVPSVKMSAITNPPPPSVFAGSGAVGIQYKSPSSNNDTTLFSTQKVYIKYAVRNVAFDNNQQYAQARLMNMDSKGGYTFQFSPAMWAKPKMVKAFKRALQKWRCATGVNFTYTCDTSAYNCFNTQQNDSINLITLSSVCNISNPNVLAETSPLGSFCKSSTTGKTVAYITDIDMRIRDNPIDGNWYYGDTTAAIQSNQYDLETVILHELGHAHLLQHINDSTKLMYWKTYMHNPIELNSTCDVAGGNYIMAKSTTPASDACVPAWQGTMLALKPILPADCNALPTCALSTPACPTPNYNIGTTFSFYLVCPEDAIGFYRSSDWGVVTGGEVIVSAVANPNTLYALTPTVLVLPYKATITTALAATAI